MKQKAMKAWIPPVVALAVAGAWVATKQQAIVSIERETEVLRERIAVAARDGGHDRTSLVESKAAETKEGEIDWKRMGESFAEIQRGGMVDMRTMMKLQEKLMAMEPGELEAALDEIEALDLSEEIRRGLEQMIFGMLSQKEPELLLKRFFDRIHDDRNGMSWQAAQAFQEWLKKEPAAAQAWFEQRLAAGDFESKSLDGKSQSRMQFEAALVASLLESDVAAAGARIEGLPEDQRSDLFQQGMMFMRLKPGTEKAFAELVRKYVPEGEQGASFAQATSMMVHQGGYERVGKFMDEIEATSEERRAIAGQAAQGKLQQASGVGGFKRETVDEMREWLAKEAPDSVDSITGEALGNVWSGKFEDRVKLLEDLHAEGGGDELLIGFLDSGQARSHRDESRRLAEMIGDEEKRTEFVERFGGEGNASRVPTQEVVPGS